VLSLAFCNELLAQEGLSFGEQCMRIASLGYDGIEIAPGAIAADPTSISDHDIASLRATVDGAGLHVTGLHWLLSAFPTLSITRASSRDETISVLKALNRLCAGLGGTVMVHGSPQQRVIESDGHAAGFVNAREVFKPVADHAAELGLTYCIEPLDPSQTAFINTIAQGAELVQAVRNPAFKTMIDTSSAHFAETKPVADVIRTWLATGQIGHIHLNDSNRGAPGMGKDPFDDIVRAISDCGWQRTVTVEPFRVQDNATNTARIAIAAIRAIETQMGAA